MYFLGLSLAQKMKKICFEKFEAFFMIDKKETERDTQV